MPRLPPMQDVMNRTRWYWTWDEEHSSQQDTSRHDCSLLLDLLKSAVADRATGKEWAL